MKVCAGRMGPVFHAKGRSVPVISPDLEGTPRDTSGSPPDAKLPEIQSTQGPIECQRTGRPAQPGFLGHRGLIHFRLMGCLHLRTYSSINSRLFQNRVIRLSDVECAQRLVGAWL